jgi:hypothetical protein
MKLLRISVPLLAFSAAAMLAACGGGGGGGATPPTTNPGPTTTTSPAPTATATPTPTVTASPTPAQSSPPSSTTVPGSSTVLSAYDGPLNGKDNWQTNGTTVADSSGTVDTGDGDTANGANGSNTIDGLGCAIGSESANTSTSYHVHSFLGLMVNGTEYAIPDGIGMKGAQDSGGNAVITNFSCAYNIHTHSASGVVHVEDPTIAKNYNAGEAAPTQYNLQAFLDIWGQTLTPAGFASFSGPVTIYTGTPTTKASNGDDLVTSYTLNTSGAGSILLSHHNAIWIVVGPVPTSLPQVEFGISS